MEVDQEVLAAICVELAGAKVFLQSQEVLDSPDVRKACELVEDAYRELNKLLAKIPD